MIVVPNALAAASAASLPDENTFVACMVLREQ